MEGVPTTGLTPDHRNFSATSHTVSLVYASAVPVQAYMNRGGPEQERLQLQVAEALSAVQYYGALKMAASRRKNTKIYLMPLGGGVFNNPWNTIGKAMSLAVEMLDADDLRVLDIQALTWEGNPAERASLSECLRSHCKFREPGARFVPPDTHTEGKEQKSTSSLCSCSIL
mmetsp:Transcript_88699/g.157073  ORF Transcript_88699/g.157073 Transcript_88699/m.157073 type:complete len:171 (+) Transcript_88699:3-515(+)